MPVASWMALVLPYTNGLTASKCEGLGKIDSVISLSPTFFLWMYPKWYFTSPEKSSLSSFCTFSKNYLKISWAGFSKTQWRVFSLPLWAMPSWIFSTPSCAADSTNCPRAVVPEFRPSIPNLLKLANFVPKKSMNAWSLASLRSVDNCSSLVSSVFCNDSIFSSSSRFKKSLYYLLNRCIYSKPILSQ